MGKNKTKRPNTGEKKQHVAEQPKPTETEPSTSLVRTESLASVATYASALSEKFNNFLSEDDKANYVDAYKEAYGPDIFNIDGVEYVLTVDFKCECWMEYSRRSLQEQGYAIKTTEELSFTMHDIVSSVNERFPIKEECSALSADMDAEETPFSTPARTAKRKASESDAESSTSVQSHNSFEALKDNVADPEIATPRAKPKPFMVWGIAMDKIKQFTEYLNRQGNLGFEVQKAGRYLRVFPDTHPDKTEIKKLLDGGNLQYYNVPDRKPLFKAVITKLDSVDPEEIQAELLRLGYDVERVSQMKSRRDGRMLPLYLVQLRKSKKAKEILNLKSLFRIRIKVERFKAQTKATQCYRCQQWNHVAENCHMDAQCAGCTGKHETRDCPNKKLEEDARPLPKCCNCGEAHPSSWKGCKKFPDRKKSYSQVLKGKSKSEPAKETGAGKASKEKAKPAPVARQRRPEPTPIYSPEELGSDFAALARIVAEIKTELQIQSFTELTGILEASLQKIKAATDPLSKKLAFLDGLSQLNIPDHNSGSGSV